MTYDEGKWADELYRFTTVEIAYSGTRVYSTSFALVMLKRVLTLYSEPSLETYLFWA